MRDFACIVLASAGCLVCACSAPKPLLTAGRARADFGVDVALLPADVPVYLQTDPGAAGERYAVLADSWLRVGRAVHGAMEPPVPVRAISPGERDQLARALEQLLSMDASQGAFPMSELDAEALAGARVAPAFTIEWSGGGRSRAVLVLPTLDRARGDESDRDESVGGETPAWREASQAFALLRSWAVPTRHEPLR